MNNFLVSAFNWCRRKFALPVDGASLGFFRIAWGALTVWESLRKIPKAEGIYSPEYFHFRYSLAPFVEPLPEVWMVKAEIGVMAIAAFMVMIGLGFRYFTVLFGLLYTHLFLIEKIYYNNHFYLTCLIAFLLAFTSADRCFSVSAWRKRKKGLNSPRFLPYWNLILLRMQVLIVYLYGGIAKFQGDWLLGEPLRHWFASKPEEQIGPPLIWFPGVLKQEWFVWTLSYGGLLFDLCIAFLLWNRKTFWPAVAMVFGFHIVNNALFKIGLFPLIGISLTILFFQPHWPRPLFRKLGIGRSGRKETSPDLDGSKNPRLASLATTWALLIYFAFQFAWPFRTIAYGGDPSWSEVGHYFSWRMMLRDKDAYLKFVFNPPEAEKLLEKLPEDKLPRIGQSHLQKMVKNPQMILSYAHALDGTFQELGIDDVEIRAVSIASLNGRPYQLLIDPSVDLAKASYGFFRIPSWIIPLEEDKRTGGYPGNADERRREIQQVFERDVQPVLADLTRKKFTKTVDELLEQAVGVDATLAPEPMPEEPKQETQN